MKMSILLFYILVVSVIPVPILREVLSDQELGVFESFDMTISENTFLSSDNSTIFLSVSENNWISSSFTNPSIISTYSFLNIEDVAISSGYLYMVGNYGGLWSVNIEDATKPVFIGRFERYDDDRHSIYIKDDYLYIGDVFSNGRGSSYIAKLQDGKTSFSGKFVLESGGSVSNVFFSTKGNLTFTTTRGSFYIFDVSDKKNPVYVSSVVTVSNQQGQVVADKNRPFVYVGLESPGSSFKVVNVTDIYSPVIVKDLPISYVQGIDCSEMYCYLASSVTSKIVDISDASNPVVVADVPDSGKLVDVVILDDTFLFASDIGGGFQIINVTDKKFPKTLFGESSGVMKAKKIAVEGDLACLVYENAASYPFGELKIFNISNKTNPVILYEFREEMNNINGDAIDARYRIGTGNNAQGIFVSDGFCYVVDWYVYASKNELRIYKIHNDSTLEYIAGYFLSDVTQIQVFDNYAYICNLFGLRIYDISNKTNLTLIGSIDTSGSNGATYKRRVFFRENRTVGFVVDRYVVSILNLTDKSNPYIISTLGGIYSPNDICVDDEGLFAFVGSYYEGFFVIDVSDLHNPSIVANINNRGADRLYYHDNYVFTTARFDGMNIFDVFDRKKPSFIMNVDAVYANSVKVRGNLAFVTDEGATNLGYTGSGGLRIIDVSDKENPTEISFIEFDRAFDSFLIDNVIYVAKGTDGIGVYRFDQKLVGKYDVFEKFCGETSVDITAKDATGEITTTVTVRKEDYCYGNGECMVNYQCKCYEGYSGSDCSKFSCWGTVFSKSEETCSGHGECVGPDECKCDFGFFDEKCSQNGYVYGSVGLSVPTAGIAASFGIICLIMLCFSICLCCCLCFAFLCIFLCCLSSVVLKQTKGLKKFQKLRNFDLLLKEQLLEDDDSVANLKFNKKLFEINYDDIKTVSILGEGGSSSIVFLAKWKGKDVAFKCFKTRTIMSKNDKFDEFEREVELISSLSHPNIIRFFGACLAPPRVGIVMEFCPKGEMLPFVIGFREKNMDIPYPIYQKIRLLNEVASSLEFLHSKNIIHRDLKSENVLISENESAKLMDFGLSRLIDEMSNAKTQRIGTAMYMAPELIKSDGHYNEKCDVFSFGILSFIIFTELSMPYGLGSTENVEFKVATDPDFRPDLETLKKSLNSEFPWIVEMIHKCWNDDPTLRYSCAEIREMLEEKGISKLSSSKNDDVPKREEDVRVVSNMSNKIGGSSEEDGSFRIKNEELIKENRSLKEEIEMLKEKILSFEQ